MQEQDDDGCISSNDDWDSDESNDSIQEQVDDDNINFGDDWHSDENNDFM